jgi:pimeloyl-ACP methyl ester carboxylesterase
MLQNNKLSGPLPPLPKHCVRGECFANLCGNRFVSSGVKEIDDAWNQIHITLSTPAWETCQLKGDLIDVDLKNPYNMSLSGNLVGATDPATLIVSDDDAYAFAADGQSAVVVVATSKDGTSGLKLTIDQSDAAGFTKFNGDFLMKERDKSTAPSKEIQLTHSDYYCFQDEIETKCAYLALLWPSDKLPEPAKIPGTDLSIPIVVTAIQKENTRKTTIKLESPPVLLVHGIWSSSSASKIRPEDDGLGKFLRDSNGLKVEAVDYGSWNFEAFDSYEIQTAFAGGVTRLLRRVNGESNMAARQVDVVAHSMGGLVTRYFKNYGLKSEGMYPSIVSDPIHRLITIGTPHLGSPLADTLVKNTNTNTRSTKISDFCTQSCTLGNAFARFGKTVAGGARSLIPDQTASILGFTSDKYQAIVGNSPQNSPTEVTLNDLLSVYIPNSSIATLLGPRHDVIVAAESQAGGSSSETVEVPNVVHTTLPVNTTLPIGAGAWTDIGEMESQQIFNQVIKWLSNGRVSPASTARGVAARSTVTTSLPSLSLEGLIEASTNDVTFTVNNGAQVGIGESVSLTPFSKTKMLKEVRVFQAVEDPADVWFRYAITVPFSVPFTASRIGTAEFRIFSIFTDGTYVVSSLSLNMVPVGTAWSLDLLDQPVASLKVGQQVRIPAMASFDTQSIDVSKLASYTVRSGNQNVIKIVGNGVVSVAGTGDDWLDVSYSGLTTSTHLVSGKSTPDPFDCLFQWAESSYPDIFGRTRTASTVSGDLVFRKYSGSSSYFGFTKAQGHTFYLGPLTNNIVADLGLTSNWMTLSGCAR